MADSLVFDENTYLTNKTNQLNTVKQDGKVWTLEDTKKALSEAGLTPTEHYNRYGLKENVSPYAGFNQENYIANKTNQLNALPGSVANQTWDTKSTADAFTRSNLNPLEHYTYFGAQEGINPTTKDPTTSYFDHRGREYGNITPGLKASLEEMRALAERQSGDPNYGVIYFNRDGSEAYPGAAKDALQFDKDEQKAWDLYIAAGGNPNLNQFYNYQGMKDSPNFNPGSPGDVEKFNSYLNGLNGAVNPSGILGTPGTYGSSIVNLSDVIPYNPNIARPERYIPTEEETVQGRLNGLLSKESPYIQTARAAGERTAHARGLLNSSINAEAGETAAIKAGFPIAQQDSDIFTRSGLQSQAFGENAAMTNLQSKYSSILQAQKAFENKDLSAQEAAQKMELMKEEAKLRTELSVQESKQKADLLTKELISTEKIKRWDLTSNDTKAISSAIAMLQDNMSSNIAKIEVDPGLTSVAKQTIISNIQKQYQANVETLATIWNVQLDWS